MGGAPQSCADRRQGVSAPALVGTTTGTVATDATCGRSGATKVSAWPFAATPEIVTTEQQSSPGAPVIAPEAHFNEGFGQACCSPSSQQQVCCATAPAILHA